MEFTSDTVTAMRTSRTRGLRWTHAFLVVLTSATMTSAAPSPSSIPPVRLIKVLPHYIDKQNRIALSPSLYERDAYQAHLRKNPSEQGGMRFDIQWKSKATNQFILRLDLRGNKGNIGTSTTLEQRVKYTGFINTWTKLILNAEASARLGELSAWHATLWDGTKLVAEQKSFLW